MVHYVSIGILSPEIIQIEVYALKFLETPNAVTRSKSPRISEAQLQKLISLELPISEIIAAPF